MHSNANVPIRAPQGWLGHSSLEVTQAYLKGQDAKSKAAQMAANTTFAAIPYTPVMPGTEAVQ
jgi:hypothetical protein